MTASRSQLITSLLLAVVALAVSESPSFLPSGLPPVPTRHHQFRPTDFRANDGSDGPRYELEFRSTDEEEAQSLPCDNPDLPGCFTAIFKGRGILPSLNTSEYGGDGWTACMWIRAFEEPYTFFHWGNTWDSTYWYLGYVESFGGMFFPTNAGSVWEETSQFHTTQDPSRVLGVWRHFCWVVDFTDGGDHSLYFEGQLAEGPHRFDNLVNPSEDPFQDSGLQNIELGASTWKTIQFGDVRIYNAPLNPEDICIVAGGDPEDCFVPPEPESDDDENDEETPPFFPPAPPTTTSPAPEATSMEPPVPETTSQQPTTTKMDTTSRTPTSTPAPPTAAPETTPQAEIPEYPECIECDGGEPFVPIEPESPPPPPSTTPEPEEPVPPTAIIEDGRTLLNYHCASWRDGRETMSVHNQKLTMAKCMSQDCAQSLEIGANKGCRWLDADGHCYAHPEAQAWCTQNPTSSYCNDGGEDWAAAPLGAAPLQGSATQWMPRAIVLLANPGTEPATYGCSCMKDCTCTGSDCYCAHPETAAPVGFNYDFQQRIRSSSSKRGECTCSCGGVRNN